METHGIAVFDVCGTITKTNNTSDFIGFVLRRDGMFKWLGFVFLRILCSFRRLPVVRRLVSDARLRERQIAFLRGYSASHLQEQARFYAEAVFAQGLVNDGVLAAMRREKEQGCEIVLVSAAIDPPVAAIAGRLDVRDFVSSELEIADGRCTGKLKRDLLGNKHIALDSIAANADLRDSSVYSDNPEDAKFMAGFARRYRVLNSPAAERRWDAQSDGFHSLVNYQTARSVRDVDSINETTHKWIYIPLLYYIISRFHRTGLFSLILREVVPATFAAWLFTSLGPSSLVVMPLSFLAFYCVYEMGGLANDFLVSKETSGTGTRRISPGVRIHVGLFLAIRIVAIALVLAWLPVGGRTSLVYGGTLLLCLGIYLVHSLIAASWRVATFSLLKLCRDCIPLLVLASYAPPAKLAWLCAVFFLIDGPWKIYMYCRQSGLARTEASVAFVRNANVLAMVGLGAVVYFTAGLPHLLALALYNVVLESVAIIRIASPVRVPFVRSIADRCS